MSCHPVVALMADVLLEHQQAFGDEKPREIRLSPFAYRQWYDDPHRVGRESVMGDGFFGVPVRCSERLPAGMDVVTVA